MTRRRQSGVALLAAVLVVALATVLIAGLLDRGEDSRARSRNLLRAEQTFQLALGTEMWAQAALRRDSLESARVDSAGDVWAQPIPPLPVPGGQLQGRLRDASGCFNLNGLVQAGEVNGPQVARFGRLLTALKLDIGLADAVVDWIDRDPQPRRGGAEDGEYLGQQPPYGAANRAMGHVSELRLVRGVDDRVYRALLPHVCALPEGARMNLNFISPAVWMSLDERITESIARSLWNDGMASFSNVDEIKQDLIELGVPEPMTMLTELTDVCFSEYFVLDSEIEVDGLPFLYSSLILREESGQVWTLARVRGRW